MRPASFNSENPVLVIGAAGIDGKGSSRNPLLPGSSVPGEIQFSLGGVGRNIAENLARLEIPTILVTVLGDDRNAQLVLDTCRDAGIDMSHTLQIKGESTGGYLALMTPSGDLNVAISDYHLAERITPDVLNSYEDLFADAGIIVIDANISRAAMDAIFDIAGRYEIPVCADPTSVFLAAKLTEFLPRLYMVRPNGTETTALCGLSVDNHDVDGALRAARHLVGLGVDVAIITLGDNGLVYADSTGGGHIPAIHTHIVDVTGAGDALTAGVIFGLYNGVPLDEAMRLGVSAATLTLRRRESVAPDLSQELLYDELVI
ncbi:MAG TPA: carbohydrate kinase family protein [Aggregatilineales bacterium]|nr:carbohydrate kinase family protein [Aggregatilineales bacterium]